MRKEALRTKLFAVSSVVWLALVPGHIGAS
jgi:hypothetical protein